MSNILAIVGRPNVGKSTLFNRLVGGRPAIVDPTSGVTRDRNYGRSDWNGIGFSVIDTGGYVMGSDDIFEEEIRKQATLAIEEADVILFLVDAVEGITPLDLEVSIMLRRSGKPVVLAANKVDNPKRGILAAEFYSLGLGTPWEVSAVSGSGTGDLLDEITKNFEPTDSTDDPHAELPKIAVVGRPNVGKSSMINALLGVDRNIVTPIAGTTRDSVYTRFNQFGFDFYLVDTAGLRKKGKVNEDIEFYSVMRAVRTIEHADVCILMIDATLGFESQDMNIFGLMQKNHRGIVIVVNKWDLVEKTNNTMKQFEADLRKRLEPFDDIPVVFTSAITKQRLIKALETALNVYQSRSRRIPTAKLNEVMLPIVHASPPPSTKGKYVKVKYITQLKTHYPSFVFFCNLPQYVREPYKRFVENRLREKFDFSGVPIEIYFREK
ncbi:MAG TPA: ribosome biogenesis GTPase Der [Bacteroidales bacterium]|nr:MAG: ribosome biogenesis GTPase Der [Bacteroidetes bacterium GWE2_42_24]OFY25266.1 MAG: ribosome biogenesis GTPase Der [Bacteroidetes bacterium GWF2_43_11]HAQ65955.1 ribosome biogenesis GTPase Der [Bacteroidales bacterium]HBZ66971.1 ribosome biogenesis GTPase Der [Bacteroidales bacterium]